MKTRKLYTRLFTLTELVLVLSMTTLIEGAEKWESHLLNYLGEFDKGPRNLYSSSSKKTLVDCKEYIRDKFHVDFNLKTYLQEFQTVDTNDGKSVSGTNVIGVLKGINYGKPEDQILLLGAHYDTRPTVAGGVVNDGSGVVAVLRAAEIFSKQAKDNGCQRNHSIMFVAFDQGETESDKSLTMCIKPCGSEAFLNSSSTYTGGGSIQTVIIMDCILNLNMKDGTQVISNSMENYFSAAKEIVLTGGAGSFVAAFGRENENDMMSELQSKFVKYQPGGMELQKFPLHFSGKPTNENITKTKEFFSLSDQISFWEAVPLVPALLLTDTCYNRGFMKECKDKENCDTLAKIQNDLASLSFMQTVISAVLSYTNDVTGGCPDINNCENGRHKCSEDADCQELFGSYHCQCKSGFEGDGYSCSDIDECKNNPCSRLQTQNKKCVNTRGAFKCVKESSSEPDNAAHVISTSLLVSFLTMAIALLLS